MASDQNSNPSLQPFSDQGHDRQPVRRSSGRKNTKASGCERKKKQPQRGMGVEKLERLRHQEWCRKMTEIDPSDESCFLVPAVASVPSMINGSASFQFPKMGMGQTGSRQSYLSLQSLVSDQFQPDLFGIGGSNFRIKSVNQISKELSSVANPVSFHSHERCYSCQKKKRIVNGENLGCGGVRSSMQISSGIEHCGFSGFSVGENHQVVKNQENHGYGTKSSLFPQLGHVLTGRPGVEVMAVHRKGSLSNSEEGNVLMEYEFFPSSSSSSGIIKNSHNDELLMMKASEASANFMVGLDNVAPSSIDLSLKLSY